MSASKKTSAENTPTQSAAESGEVFAAIAMALHETINVHDTETYVVTIQQDGGKYSPWNTKAFGVRGQLK